MEHWKERRVKQRPHAGMRGVAYAIIWLCIVFPLWIISLIVQAHYEYVPPLWLGLWFAWIPMTLVFARELWLILRR